ncbi:Superoxide dismutase (Cu-Zn)-like protein 2 [Hyalella azteca]|nr:Superoxide dismutase (Cu-Zn)-like protein 2 [Hyalella azteca]
MHVEVIASDPKLSLDNNDGHPHHDNHHHNHLPPDHIYHPRNQKDVIKATCDLRPNTAPSPFSLVRGNITITQKKNEEGPVYFDLTIPGFRMNSVSEAVFGFHVHERPVTNGDCSSAGGHFNPHDSVHGGPTDEIRHVGDLGNVVIPEGGLDGYLIVDHSVAFSGEDSIVGKSIVMHADTDDLGRGGDKGSQATGNAGARISCCTIHLVPEPRFRFG